MNHGSERRFTCTDVGERQTYQVVATQTHRAGPTDAKASLEWQFFIESLGLILERRSPTQYVSIDDPKRVFRSNDRAQPPYGSSNRTFTVRSSETRQSTGTRET